MNIFLKYVSIMHKLYVALNTNIREGSLQDSRKSVLHNDGTKVHFKCFQDVNLCNHVHKLFLSNYSCTYIFWYCFLKN